MKTDAELKVTGIRALIAALGPVDAERFIATMRRQRLDYTRWRHDQWQNTTVVELSERARALRAGAAEQQ